MYAQIMEGHVDLADILFLVAVIMYGVAAILAWTQGKALVSTLGYIGGALLAFGLLAL